MKIGRELKFSFTKGRREKKVIGKGRKTVRNEGGL